MKNKNNNKQRMLSPWRALLLGALCASATSASRAADDGDALVRYVACPVYRDTDAGRKSGCWLATEPASGRRYDLSESLNKPLLGRQVLVEGIASGERDICGGVLLKPVRISVLEATCPPTLVPAEGYPSKPSVTPADILQPLSVPRRVPEPPFAPKDFHIVFDYGDDRLVYQSAELPLERASLLAIAAQAREVRITGYADTAGVQASGQRLREPLALARARAEMAAEALRRLGVPAQRLKLAWRGDPAPLAEAGAMGEPGRRRVTITVSP